jgi:hypothetical protein
VKKVSKALTSTNKEDILDILNTPGFKALLGMLDKLVDNLEREVINCDISSTQFALLAVKKAKAEGARLTLNRLKKEIHSISGVTTGGRNE